MCGNASRSRVPRAFGLEPLHHCSLHALSATLTRMTACIEPDCDRTSLQSGRHQGLNHGDTTSFCVCVRLALYAYHACHPCDEADVS